MPVQVTADRRMDAADKVDERLSALTTLLDLDGFEVVDAAEDRSQKVRRLAVVPTEVMGQCPHCGQPTDDRHACYDRDVVDLPTGGWKTELVVRAWQFRCGHGGKFFSPRHPAPADAAHATGRFLDRLADLAAHADMAAARDVFGDAVRVTVDRFHVMKNFQDRLTDARRAVQRSLPMDRARRDSGHSSIGHRSRLTIITGMSPLHSQECPQSCSARQMPHRL